MRRCALAAALFTAVVLGLLASAAGGDLAAERGGRIAFAGDGGYLHELFVVRPEGSGLRRLTRNRVDDAEPRWSPEGRRLLSFGSSGIVIRDALGKVLRRLPKTHGLEARWSRDGRSIAFLVFACDDPTGKGDPICADLWVVRADGRARSRVVASNVDTTQVIGRLYSWAPGGRRLVYAAVEPQALVVAGRAGGAGRVLRGTRGVGAHQPDWSPDGRLIAFLRQKAPFGGADIYVVAPDGSALRPLVRSRSDLKTPTWSPDGRSIAYFRLVDATPGSERYAVVVADENGGGRRRLGVTGTWDSLDWSPDSRSVVWTDFEEIWVARADGRGRPRLVAKGQTPDWG